MHLIQHWTPLHIEKNQVTPIREVVKLPVFPEFKKLTLDDRHIIEEFVKQHPPYSDFNFTSLWCYNTEDRTKYSILYDNIVIQMLDYTSNKVNFMYMGVNEPLETMNILFRYLENFDNNELCMIPEHTIASFKTLIHNYYILEDRNNFDYVYDINEQSELNGNKHRGKRNFINRFKRFYPESEVKIINLGDTFQQEEILSLFFTWEKNKEKFREDTETELIATKRFFDLGKFENIIAIGVFVKGRLVGYTICELLNSDCVLEHFEKADTSFIGIFQFMRMSLCNILKLKGYKYLNCEQDLGIPSLRQSKENWCPSTYLKKYIVTQKNASNT